jgi:hypothetical protein
MDFEEGTQDSETGSIGAGMHIERSIRGITTLTNLQTLIKTRTAALATKRTLSEVPKSPTRSNIGSSARKTSTISKIGNSRKCPPLLTYRLSKLPSFYGT